ncbi:MAG: hypothetical protein Fur0041_11860 [Bacteroidia bacterium]
MDQGKTFRKISGDLTRGGKTGDVPYGTISTIHESPLKFGLIYTGSDDGLIHVTKDGGNTWTRISDKLPQHMRVNRIIASAHAEGRVYAVLSGFQWDHFNAYVYRSDDYGNTWTPIGTDLPMEPVNVIREDPVNENLLFIGTDNGLYVSFDRGKTTMRMFNNLPAVAIHDLVIHPREKDLIVGTHGRSVYIANIAALEQLNDSIMSKDLFVYDLNPIRQYNNYVEDDGKYKVFTATKLNLTYFSGKNEPHTVTVYTGDGGQKLTVLRDTSERGVNFINTELTVDSAYAANYKEWCKTSGIEDKPAETEHGKLSFVQGEYLIEVRSASGLISSKKVRILKPRM